jgi:hypothetical protein
MKDGITTRIGAQGDTPDETFLDELTVAQLSDQAASYAAWAKAAEATRDVFDRLAKRCAAMAAQRKPEERQAA